MVIPNSSTEDLELSTKRVPGRASIVIHGGVDTVLEGKYKEVVAAAGRKGIQLLKNGHSAVDAVEAAVMVMEDAGIFDAGSGSVLCSDGKVRMHASIMEGRTLAAGAVTLIEDVKNPVSVARLVMEKTDHVMLGGDGATAFARAMGFPVYNPASERRRQEYDLFKKKFYRKGDSDYFLDWKFYERARKLQKKHPEIFGMETVGAVAVDRFGNLAAAASTGGMTLQMPGRIGDTAIIGSGIFADKRGAVSVTGWGEVSIKYGIAREVASWMGNKRTPQEAVTQMIRRISRNERAPIGLIAVNSRGEVGIDYNTVGMAHAYFVKEDGPLFFLRKNSGGH